MGKKQTVRPFPQSHLQDKGKKTNLEIKGKSPLEQQQAELSLIITGKPIKTTSPPSLVPAYRAYKEGEEDAYDTYLIDLAVAKEEGYKLDPKQEQQLITAKSNAAYYSERLKNLAQSKGSREVEGLKNIWDTQMKELLKSMGNSIFTRDIDLGELKGQMHSEGTMNAVERMKKGFGRLRTMKDFNRGGATGSYVRFLSDKPRNRALGTPSKSSPLNTGSIASLGITILYDAASTVEDNSQPAGILFNEQDSAGRILGTKMKEGQSSRRQSAFSEKTIGQANPFYYKKFGQISSKGPLTDEFILKNAIESLSLLDQQALHGQTDEQEYNEGILFSGANFKHIKAIIIHTPSTGAGSPPTMAPISKEEQDRFILRQSKRMLHTQQLIQIIEHREKKIDERVRQLRGTSRENPANRTEITKLESEKSDLLQSKNKYLLVKPKPALTERAQKPTAVTTPVIIRDKGNWENHTLPEPLKGLEHKTGYKGVPLRYLFFHANPAKYRREELPALAEHIWQIGLQNMLKDMRREAERKKMEEDASRFFSPLPILQSDPIPHIPGVISLNPQIIAWLNSINQEWQTPFLHRGENANEGNRGHGPGVMLHEAIGVDVAGPIHTRLRLRDGLKLLKNNGMHARCFIYALIMGLTAQSQNSTIDWFVDVIAHNAHVEEGWIATDSDAARRVIAAIEEIFHTPIQVIEIMQGVDGPIIAGRSHNNATIEELRPIVIFNNGAHYEAII